MPRLQWPGGWYLVNGDRVVGPYPAADVFRHFETIENPRECLASRPGIADWYPLTELAALYEETHGPDVGLDLSTPEREALFLSRFDAMIKARRQTRMTTRAPIDRSTAHLGAFDAPEQSRERPNSSLTIAAPPRPELTMAESANPFLDAEPRIAWLDAANCYHQIRAAYRLGEHRSVTAHCLPLLVVTIGLYLPLWFRSAQREAIAHLGLLRRSAAWPWWLIVVPGVHLVMFYQLALLIRELDTQNQRPRALSLAHAILAAILPPLGILTLQARLNAHWLFHIHDALVTIAHPLEPTNED